MKTAVLCGIVLTSAATAFAQAPVTPPQTTTLTGCVTGGSKSRPIALVNALVLPGGTATTPPVPTDRPEPTTALFGSTGTSGVVRGTAPAGSSTSGISGYRLSGTDMTPWIGRRVEVVGTLVSSSAASSAAPAPAPEPGSKTDPLPLPEFRVVSVQPITGPCPAK